MIKILKLKFECGKCGTVINLHREIVIDEYTKEIKIIYPRCSCGNREKSKFRLLDLDVGENKDEKTND